MTARFPLTGLLAAALLAASGLSCGGADEPLDTGSAQAFPGGLVGKADIFGRALAGVAAPYEADFGMIHSTDALASNMGARRAVAWDVVMRVLDPVPLLGLADAVDSHEEVELAEGEIPDVARWQTWYGVDDFKRMFRHLFEGLGPLGRAERLPFSAEDLDEAFQWNASALDRSERWPLERFLKYVAALGVCPSDMPDDECAKSLQSNFSGATGGNSRITYSPATMRHLLENYGAILGCLETLDAVGLEQVPEDPDGNFSFCFQSEFPADAALIKAHWVRSDFDRKLPAFDTDAEALLARIGPTKIADWADGDRLLDPGPDEVLTIALRNGDTYRLAGLHIMTKELRHWLWITLWWSDLPDEDFGADRPVGFANLDPIWSHYKMGVVTDYRELDPDPASSFSGAPTLAAALDAVADEPTWLSNPYIEHGRGNARTNCIGCHQHGGSTVGPDLNADGELDPFDLDMVIETESLFPENGRTEIRSLFPADYLWSMNRVDNLGQVIKSEVSNFDFVDKDEPEIRALAILALEHDADLGSKTFADNCTPCHGDDGMGTPQAPSLYDRVPGLTDLEIATTLITGKSPMPSWSHFSDQEIADVRAFLRLTFDEP